MLVLGFVLACAPADGAATYAEHCTPCHGKEGHGDGPTAKELKYKPRDFREGKFAFGNTADAMAKTVMSGIPGEEQARMPAFKSVLSAADVAAVVDYVRSLMPPQPQPTPADMTMVPEREAQIVRGILPDLDDANAPPLARGLLVGLPSGFTFEYAIATPANGAGTGGGLRLLAVRRGDFVRRSDWEERGGKPLTPLGTVIARTAAHPFDGLFMALVGEPGHESLPVLHVRLRSTHVAGAVATLTSELALADGKPRFEVVETPCEEVVTGGAGFTQSFAVRSLAGEQRLQFIAAQLPNELGGRATERDGSPKWLVLPRADGMKECVLLRASLEPEPNIPATHFGWYSGGNGGTTCLETTLPIGATPVVIRRTVIVRPDVTPEVLAQMTREIRK